MKRGESDVMRKVERKRRRPDWRAHPVPYGSEEYPWNTPPMACAACGTRDGRPYRVLRTEQAQALVLHDDCGRAFAERLNPLPLWEMD